MNKCSTVLVTVLVSFLAKDALAVDANSGLESVRSWPLSKARIDLQGYVQGAQVFDYSIVNGIAGPKTLNTCFRNAPSQQPQPARSAHVNSPLAPAGYNQIAAWLNVTNDGTGFGTAEVRSLEIWRKDRQGRVSLVSDDLFCKTCGTERSLVWGSMLQNKADWGNAAKWALDCQNSGLYPDTCRNPVVFRLNWTSNQWGLFKIPTVIFPTSDFPNQVFHPWTAVWDATQPQSPRPDAVPGDSYAVRVVAKISGAARVQVGYDFFVPTGSPPIACQPIGGFILENCEGAISNWQCAGPGWVSVVAGVPGIIQP